MISEAPIKWAHHPACECEICEAQCGPAREPDADVLGIRAVLAIAALGFLIATGIALLIDQAGTLATLRDMACLP